jgi:cyclic pyranopterin phosphate synthase
MPAEIYGEKYNFLPKPEILTFEEIIRLTKVFVEIGITKVRLTGGEPLIRKNIEELVAGISSIPGVEDLALTTNGFLLSDKAWALKKAGLNRITVSLDSIDPAIFKTMNGRGYGPDKILDGIRAAEAVGLSPVKVNAVVQKGVNDSHIVELARYFRHTSVIVRFIEYMDVGNLNKWNSNEVVLAGDIVKLIDHELPLKLLTSNYGGEVAARYGYKDGSGEIGIISSISQPFCGDCTRARISTDGKLITCLFATGGTDLKALLRNGSADHELQKAIVNVWAKRTDRYSEERMYDIRKPNSTKKIEMYQIGG